MTLPSQTPSAHDCPEGLNDGGCVHLQCDPAAGACYYRAATGSQTPSAAPAGEMGHSPLLEALARREHAVMLDLAKQHGFATVSTSDGMEPLWADYDRQTDALKVECRAVPERILRWIAEEGYALAPEPERDPAAGGREAAVGRLVAKIRRDIAEQRSGMRVGSEVRLNMHDVTQLCDLAAAPAPQVAEPSGVEAALVRLRELLDWRAVEGESLSRAFREHPMGVPDLEALYAAVARPAPRQESALREALAKLVRVVQQFAAERPNDWRDEACAECKGSISAPGFQCARHAAASLLNPTPGGSDAG